MLHKLWIYRAHPLRTRHSVGSLQGRCRVRPGSPFGVLVPAGRVQASAWSPLQETCARRAAAQCSWAFFKLFFSSLCVSSHLLWLPSSLQPPFFFPLVFLEQEEGLVDLVLPTLETTRSIHFVLENLEVSLFTSTG